MSGTQRGVEHLRDIDHVSKFDHVEVQYFFEINRDLKPGKSMDGANWVGRTEAGVRALFKSFEAVLEAAV